MGTVEVPLKEIPDALIDAIKDELLTYFVSLTACSDESEKKLIPLGSGTLVKVVDAKFILTAAHVWKASEWASSVLISLKKTETSFVIQRKYLSAKLFFVPGESGPDIALLELSPSDAATIGASKSFLDLKIQRDDLENHPLKEENGFFAVVGIIGEKTEIVPREDGAVVANLRGDAFFGVLENYTETEGSDYFDLTANSSLPGIPKSFGGVSGGSVWQLDLRVQNGSISWDRKRLFRGVAFYEFYEEKGRQLLRCNGPRTLYELAWQEWKLSAQTEA
jgi:hypothetical protein